MMRLTWVLAMEGGRMALATEEHGKPRAASFIARELGVGAVLHQKQVHGSAVVTVEDHWPRARGTQGSCLVGEGDALITSRSDIAVAVLTADCVPLIMADRLGRAVAAVHAGWRGVAAGIVRRCVDAMRTISGAQPSAIDAAIGPAAGGCCYEVGDEVVDALHGSMPTSTLEQRWLLPGMKERRHVDLKTLVAVQLAMAGFSEDHVRVHPACTICSPDCWPSYRREGIRTGRIWSAVACRGGDDA